MKRFQDLPAFALEKILCNLSFVAKANLLNASILNKELNLRLNSLCKFKRPKFCPFCILFLGTNYSEKNGERYIEDLQNQILNSKTGDLNWEWSEEENVYTIDKVSTDSEYCIGYYSHGGVWNQDLMHILEQKNCHQKKLIIEYFQKIYNLNNPEVNWFQNTSYLYDHFLAAHSDLIFGFDRIMDSNTLQSYMESTMMKEAPILLLDKEEICLSRHEVYKFIHFHIACSYMVFVDSLENSMNMCMKVESKSLYFLNQTHLLFTIAEITIKNLKFESWNAESRALLTDIKRIIKLYEVISTINACLIPDTF